ncbi:iron-sulfur cluster biosynthesis family protein [Priestia sp. HNGD-A6]|uniref:iron-sulfur cluster biosynthesis family protein n=1 Tax=Priestia sp. HNGD-A6 TaxID=3092666 RepID=UPI00389128EA
MNIHVTPSAKEALQNVEQNQMIQLSFDRGSCDIVNTIYEMKIISKRSLQPYEKVVTVEDLEFIVDDDMEEVYDNELVIDHAAGAFVFKSHNQIFNNRVGLRYINS